MSCVMSNRDVYLCENKTTQISCAVTSQLISAFVFHTRIEKMVQVGKDQEKAQSEKDSHSKNRGGKKTKLTIRHLYHETYRKPNEQLFSQQVATQLP